MSKMEQIFWDQQNQQFVAESSELLKILKGEIEQLTQVN